MEKTLLRPIKIDNGCKQVIKRYPSLRPRYIKGVMMRLEKMPNARKFARSQVYRVINDKVAINDTNKVIKDTFLCMTCELHPDAAQWLGIKVPSTAELQAA